MLRDAAMASRGELRKLFYVHFNIESFFKVFSELFTDHFWVCHFRIFPWVDKFSFILLFFVVGFHACMSLKILKIPRGKLIRPSASSHLQISLEERAGDQKNSSLLLQKLLSD
jgi:hypothetical protein